MPLGFIHLIGAWTITKVYQFFSKNKISKYTWFFLLFGAILPDIDYIFEWTFDIVIHRTITHSLFFAVIILLISLFSFYLVKEKKCRQYSFALFIGILIHLLLDFFSIKGIPFFWPHEMFISYLGINLSVSSFMDNLSNSLRNCLIDIGLGTAWILYLSLKGKVKF
jgi:membrane-bound metal-dependent hydrolase YbcI (DUF457 family)